MPRFLAEALYPEPTADLHWDTRLFARHQAGRHFLSTGFTEEISLHAGLLGKHRKMCHRLLPSSFDGGAIDDPPDQQLWPLPVPDMRKKDPLADLNKALTGQEPEPEEPFGADGEDLEPSVKDAHDQAKSADEYAGEAQEAAEEAVSWDHGVVSSVTTAEKAWKGALFAKKVDEALEKAELELAALGDRSKISDEIKEFHRRAENVIAEPEKAYTLNFPLKRMKHAVNDAGKLIEPILEQSSRPLVKFMSDKKNPPLFPTDDAPGVREDGGMMVPFRVPARPDPMVMEEMTPPRVQETMPSGTLPLDMSNLKGVA